MGNCNCFKISSQQNASNKNDFLIEEDSLNNIYKPYNSDNATTNGLAQKFSPRGGNNPTQNNMKKSVIKIKKGTGESTTDMDNTNNANVNNEKIEKIDDIINQEKIQHMSTQKISNKNLTEILKIKDISKLNKDKKNNINIIFLGDKCVGKTSIVYQYISSKFDQYYIQTIIKEELSKDVLFNNKRYKLNFNVTSGVPQYQGDYSNLYNTSDFFVVCYDITSPLSFLKAKEIINKEILQHLFLYNDNYANVILLGNKIDLKERHVEHDKVSEYCKKYNIDFYEVSAKLNTNITKIFTKILEVYDEAINRIVK